MMILFQHIFRHMKLSYKNMNSNHNNKQKHKCLIFFGILIFCFYSGYNNNHKIFIPRFGSRYLSSIIIKII